MFTPATVRTLSLLVLQASIFFFVNGNGGYEQVLLNSMQHSQAIFIPIVVNSKALVLELKNDKGAKVDATENTV